MKISIDVECSPQEARAFLGLPDVATMQDALMEKIQSQMMENLGGMDAETMFKNWMPGASNMPGGMEGLETLQKAFWAQMTGAASSKD